MQIPLYLKARERRRGMTDSSVAKLLSIVMSLMSTGLLFYLDITWNSECFDNVMNSARSLNQLPELTPNTNEYWEKKAIVSWAFGGLIQIDAWKTFFGQAPKLAA